MDNYLTWFDMMLADYHRWIAFRSALCYCAIVKRDWMPTFTAMTHMDGHTVSALDFRMSKVDGWPK